MELISFLRWGLFKNVSTQAGAWLASVFVMWIAPLPEVAKVIVVGIVGILAVALSGVASYFNPNSQPATEPYKPTPKN